MSTEIFMGGLEALKKYPVPIVAKAFVKAGRYHGGKHGRWKYIQTIIDEEAQKGGRSGHNFEGCKDISSNSTGQSLCKGNQISRGKV